VEWSLGGPLSELCPRWLPLLKIENSAKNHLKIIFSETAGPIGPNLWWNGFQMVLLLVLEELIKMQKANDRWTTDAQW
jgi:hypothetical protein